MKILLPGKKFLILILVLASVNPLNYALMNNVHPEGKVFTGYIDDAFQLALMKSAKWEFQSPWDFGISVFQNPILGASYTFVVLGTIPTLLNFDLFLTMMVLKFIFSVFYLILIYNILLVLMKSKKYVNVAFVIFLLASGIGWIFYAVSAASGSHYTSVIGYAFTDEFEELGGGISAISHITRLYWLLPEITGLLSLLLFMHRKRILSGLFLGLTIFFYPTFSVAFALIILIYSIVDRYNNKGSVLDILRDVLPVALISAVFAVPWALNYFSYRYYFTQYSLWYNGEPLIKLLVSFAPVIILSLYGFVKSTNSVIKNKLFIRSKKL